MRKDQGIDELAHLVYEGIKSEARDVLKHDRASVEVTKEGNEPIVRLRPHNDAAASLAVELDTGRQVTCFVGDQGLPYEVFSSDPSEIVDEVKTLAKAVIGGQYSERTKDSSEHSKSIATWDVEGKRHQARYNLLRAPKAGDPEWRLIAYEPY